MRVQVEARPPVVVEEPEGAQACCSTARQGRIDVFVAFGAAEPEQPDQHVERGVGGDDPLGRHTLFAVEGRRGDGAEALLHAVDREIGRAQVGGERGQHFRKHPQPGGIRVSLWGSYG